jgi:hypothetical protein
MFPRRVYRHLLITAIVAVGQFGSVSVVLAQTESENFTAAPADWVFAGPERSYGFSATNNTGGTSPAGEAGGTFQRDNIRSHYADVTLGGLITQATSFSATGELFAGVPNDPNSEMLIAHFEKDYAGMTGDFPSPGSRNLVGFRILEGTPTDTTFRWWMQIYTDDQSVEYFSDIGLASFAAARGFTYSWDAATRTLTGSILGADGSPLPDQTRSITAAEGVVFSLDSFGLTVGTNDDANSSQSFQVFIDGVTYSTAQPGDFDGSAPNDPPPTGGAPHSLARTADIDALWAHVRGPADDRMFDLDDDALINNADVDRLVQTILGTFYGDANLDGQVDITDLGELATNWQTSDGWLGGDFDGTGFVDITDLGLLATNWQAGVGTPTRSFSLNEALASLDLPTGIVPEPASIGILAGICLAASARRRSRRRVLHQVDRSVSTRAQ